MYTSCNIPARSWPDEMDLSDFGRLSDSGRRRPDLGRDLGSDLGADLFGDLRRVTRDETSNLWPDEMDLGE